MKPKKGKSASMSVDRGALFFNDMVAISERVYMDCNSSCDSNYAPLNQGTKWPEQVKPETVPMLDLGKVIILKIKSNLDNCSDQEPTSRDELGRPKRCPDPRLEKLILDRHGVSTGARNLYLL
jgi:hypothetical protein